MSEMRRIKTGPKTLSILCLPRDTERYKGLILRWFQTVSGPQDWSSPTVFDSNQPRFLMGVKSGFKAHIFGRLALPSNGYIRIRIITNKYGLRQKFCLQTCLPTGGTT